MFENSYSLTLYDGPIVFIEYFESAKIGEKEIKKMVSFLFDLIGDQKFHTISRFPESANIFNGEAKAYISKHERLRRQQLSNAILTKSVSVRLLLIAFLRFYKPNIPTMAYKSLSKAKPFLLKHGLTPKRWQNFIEVHQNTSDMTNSELLR